MTSKTTLGYHHFFDLTGCDASRLNDLEYLRTTLLTTLKDAGATIVNDFFHTFHPHGVTGVIIIAESHLAAHTWPEFNALSIDLFSCTKNLNIDGIRHGIVTGFRAKQMEYRCLERMPNLKPPARN